MKKFALLFALVLGFGLTGVQAQSDSDKKASKSCAQTCSKTAKKATKQADAGSADAAAKLASLDESIDVKVCEKSGNVSYTRKAVGDDGEAKYEPVSYSASTNKFVSLTDSEKKILLCIRFRLRSECECECECRKSFSIGFRSSLL